MFIENFRGVEASSNTPKNISIGYATAPDAPRQQAAHPLRMLSLCSLQLYPWCSNRHSALARYFLANIGISIYMPIFALGYATTPLGFISAYIAEN